MLTCEATPQERFNLSDFAISLTQPLDSGACRLFIAAASMAVNDQRELVTQFIGQLVAAGKIMQGAVARPNGTRLPRRNPCFDTCSRRISENFTRICEGRSANGDPVCILLPFVVSLLHLDEQVNEPLGHRLCKVVFSPETSPNGGLKLVQHRSGIP
jgi:hypothetical protein